MNIPKTAKRLASFMEASEQEIVSLFQTIPNAQTLSTYSTKKPIIYVPGTRKDRVLLVAHNDTVFDKPAKVMQVGTWLMSAQAGVGIGADDRAGVCALWMLRKLGHSLLIVPDEEVGCLGSTYAAENYADLLKDHSFMIQFDRAGATDLVYYDSETKEFEKYLETHFYPYSYAPGSFTDIVELMPALDVAGVNISIGYYNQHTAKESINILEFIQTVYLSMHLLRQEKIPAFKPSPAYDYYGYSGYDWGYNRSSLYSSSCKKSGDTKDTEEEENPFESNLTSCELEEADVIICPACKESHTDTFTDMYMMDWDEALCGFCNTMFAPVNHCFQIKGVTDDETNTYKAMS